jgi:hypothetical protein
MLVAARIAMAPPNEWPTKSTFAILKYSSSATQEPALSMMLSFYVTLVQTAHQLYIARFVLGLAEAGYFPGIGPAEARNSAHLPDAGFDQPTSVVSGIYRLCPRFRYLHIQLLAAAADEIGIEQEFQ